MFLKSITINNYKSIQKATVSFENGLNIIIGKNGAGKSNLLQFIHEFVFYYSVLGRTMLSRNVNVEYDFTLSYEFDDSIFDLIIYLKKDKDILNDKIEYTNEFRFSKLKDGELEYKDKTIIIKGDSNKRISNKELDSFSEEMNIIAKISRIFVSYDIPYNAHWLAQPNKFEIDNELFANSESTYDGLSIFYDLNYMTETGFVNQKSLKFEDIKAENCKEIILNIFSEFDDRYKLNYYLPKYSPIKEIRLNPNINIYKADNKILVENLLIDFKINDNWVPWSYLSDGSKRLFYLITQCLSLKDGLLLIEEPELGIHPHQLFNLMAFLKEQAHDKQIIISTHSPIVLDVLRQDELNRITIAKIENGSSQFVKLTEEQINAAKEYMNNEAELSYYWLHSDLENND